MGKILALIRAHWLSALSYRVGFVFSLLGLVAVFVPVYFVSDALQPLLEDSIQSEGGQYFGFLVIGLATMGFVLTATSALAARIQSMIATGTLEAILETPTSMPVLVLGFTGYDFNWTAVRSGLLLVGGWLLGMPLVWPRLPAATFILGLVVVSYLAFGVMAASLVLVFRTTGPFIAGIITGSSLLGGVYYSTSVIPSWIGSLSAVIPLTYGLRAIRRALLDDAAWGVLLPDVAILAAMSIGLTGLATVSLTWAMRYARRSGNLGHF